jgi:hypothetical protein
LKTDLEPNIIEYIGILAKELFDRKSSLSAIDTSVKALWGIGAKSCQINEIYGKKSTVASLNVAEQLKKIENLIGFKQIEKNFKDFEESLKARPNERELEIYLTKYKLYYNKVKDFLV